MPSEDEMERMLWSNAWWEKPMKPEKAQDEERTGDEK